jgi:hypothetical protein
MIYCEGANVRFGLYLGAFVVTVRQHHPTAQGCWYS